MEINVLGIDVGLSRIGVAISHRNTNFALPLLTLSVQADGSELQELLQLIEQHQVGMVFVGLPLLMSGKSGQAARMASSYARRLAKALPREIEVRMIDERLSSATAHSRLSQGGLESRKHKAFVDQVAAAVILETVLESASNSADAPGNLVLPS